MAKWRNMALICTIAMPLVMGSGTAHAAEHSIDVAETDVTLHKYITTNTVLSGNDYYWGNGTTGLNNPFTAENSEWSKAGKGYSFTAYKLANGVIKLATDGTVTISTERVPELGLAWSDLLTVRSGETAAYKEATNPSTDVSDNIVELKSGVTEQQVADLQQYLAKTSSDRQTVTTNNDGDATFDDLANGQWIVFETDAPDAVSTLAQPMILNLPMKNAAADTAQGTWFDGSGDYNVNLYPKDFMPSTEEPTIDKMINTLQNVSVDELTAKWDDAKGHPVYGGNVVSDDGAAVKSAVTFLENDNLYGVSRGKSYNYTLDMQLPKSIDKFSSYGFVDTIPYEVTVNSWTMYAQIDGQLTALLQAVDPNGNDSKSSSDGLSQPKGDYDSERIVTPDGKEADVNFKFAEVRGDNGKTAAAMFGYTGELGKSKTAIAEQTAYIATHLLRMQGYTATYQFNGDVTTDAGQFGANRAIIDADTGEMQITTKELFRDKLAAWAPLQDDTTGHTSIVFKLNTQTNSAAQANTGDNKIDNKVQMLFDNGATNQDTAANKSALRDSSYTTAVGWEFHKTDKYGNPLRGAGFDMGRLVTPQNIENVISQLLSEDNNGNPINDTSYLEMFEHLKDSPEYVTEFSKSDYTTDAAKIAAIKEYLDGQAADLRKRVAEYDAQPDSEKSKYEVYVWFIHLDNAAHGAKQPIVTDMTSSMEMGDIYWVTNNALATTHKSGRDVYLQYCGVADRRYLFRESIAPDGYKQMADVKFTLSSGPDSVYQPTDEFPDLKDAKGVSLGTDSQITGLVENLDGHYVHIKNYAKGMWPVSGGIGALVVFALGGVLMTSAYLKRRFDRRND